MRRMSRTANTSGWLLTVLILPRKIKNCTQLQLRAPHLRHSQIAKIRTRLTVLGRLRRVSHGFTCVPYGESQLCIFLKLFHVLGWSTMFTTIFILIMTNPMASSSTTTSSLARKILPQLEPTFISIGS